MKKIWWWKIIAIMIIICWLGLIIYDNITYKQTNIDNKSFSSVPEKYQNLTVSNLKLFSSGTSFGIFLDLMPENHVQYSWF